MRYRLIIVFSVLAIWANAQQESLENENVKVVVHENGTISSLLFKQTGYKAEFLSGDYLGPSWYVQVDGKTLELPSRPMGEHEFRTYYDNLEMRLQYQLEGDRFLIVASITNNQKTPVQPDKIGLRLGVNTYMDKYPDWEDKLFPTLLRSEKSHFWGYFMSPLGKIVTVSSPDPIASWSHDYSISWGEPPYSFYGHRVNSANLDLVNRLPLPERHPQDLYQLKPGEKRIFRIYLDEVDGLENIGAAVNQVTQAPFIQIASTSGEVGKPMTFSILGNEKPIVELIEPNGTKLLLETNGTANDLYRYTVEAPQTVGLYTIRASSTNGKTSEATFYVRKPYSWYMDKAMKAVMDYPQKASVTHCESWYGFYTTYAGGKHLKGNAHIAPANGAFQEIFPLVIDPVSVVPQFDVWRIQNTSSMIGILVDRYELYGERTDLERCLKLSDVLLDAQASNGSYVARHNGKSVHYTSVIYIAKSLMELLDVLEPLKNENNSYKKKYDVLYESVEKAMDELVRNKTNIETEGQHTFEDGMISCSALQLGKFALMQTNSKKREKYQLVAAELLEQHRCLQQLVIPDARMRSGSLRFWEAQYDVVMANNFFNSPHGWSSWSTYAKYYLYLLTGDTVYLQRTFNGLDAAMQMIDLESGELRWAFMVNPFVEVTQIDRNIQGATPLDYPGKHYHALEHAHKRYIHGEDYVDMVSDWFFPNANDNDVHEHFKCLEEVALGKCYVAEKPDGTWLAYNCSVTQNGNTLTVTPSEAIVEKLHLNLTSAYTVNVKFAKNPMTKKAAKGMTWIGG